MKSFAAFAVAGIAGLASAITVKRDASTPITVQGNAFFQGSNRFFIRGVDYQPGGSSGAPGAGGAQDPLEDDAFDACSRDIKNFQDLGLNAIRVYTVDNSKGHDKCMNALQAAGIYLILDVNTPNAAINRVAPAQSYNAVYLQNVFATIDAFAKYPNTMAFFSGNEVINSTTASTATAPFVKAVTRDMKTYIANRQYRHIMVGYSAADVSSNRYETAEYMNCGQDDTRSDFFAFNDYSWCDPSSFTQSGWDQKVKLFSNYSLPIFLSEFGCNTNQRDWEEIASLYGTDMEAVYSGGLVYEYSNEASNYGLGTIDGSTYTPNGDYNRLKEAYQKTPIPSGDAGYRSNSGGANQCPGVSSTWMVSNSSLPVMPSGAQVFMTQGAGQGKGLNVYSMQAGSASVTWDNTGAGGPTTTSVANGGAGASSKSAANVLVPQLSYAPLLVAGAWAVASVLGGSFFLL